MFAYSSTLSSINLKSANFVESNYADTKKNSMLAAVASGIKIRVLNANSQAFINQRLSEASITGTVTIG